MAASSVCSSDGVLNARQSALTILNTRCKSERPEHCPFGRRRALRRSLREVLPLGFSVTIPPKERQPNLSAKLQAELPGIMAWMIAGCLEWQRIGLAPPAVVTDAIGLP